MNISDLIKELVAYGLERKLISPSDEIYSINRLLELFGADEYAPGNLKNTRELNDILEDMLSYAVKEKKIEDTSVNRDLFDTKIMGLITPPPSAVRSVFSALYEKSPGEATDWYYGFSKDTNYIRTDRIKKDEKWSSDTEFGSIDITINLSKPEKDPRDIAKAGAAKASGYPACLLCAQNEGYAGRFNHPARQNHRIIPLSLCGENYFLQYSPYVYYNEHCIVFNKEHIPMKIDRDAFSKLLDFVRQFPHYNVGSNADLPIVGGSILSHDHFQGGCYEFPMQRAPYEKEFVLTDHPKVHAGRIKWPLSTIRLQSADINALVDAADHILASWRDYTDEEAFIYAYSDSAPHNTITPIARMRDDKFELDLVLRNNITTDEHPLGLYHPHSQYHHIKKENIGLIEVMGLAILPSRLKNEIAILKEDILKGQNLHEDERIASHAAWADEWMGKYDKINKDNIDAVVRNEIALVFSHVLEDAGVYKRDTAGFTAFDRFIEKIG